MIVTTRSDAFDAGQSGGYNQLTVQVCPVQVKNAPSLLQGLRLSDFTNLALLAKADQPWFDDVIILTF